MISCGRRNLFGHPHPETIDSLQRRRVHVYRTDRNGTITLIVDGDHIFVEKLSYRLRAPRRGEIVVFENPHDPNDTPLIKRIVAVGGDTVEVRGQDVYVNGALVERRALDGACSQWDVDEPSGRWYEERCRALRQNRYPRR